MAEEPGLNPAPDFASLPSAFQYSPSLNCVISLSKGSGIEILDVHSRKITTQVPLATELDDGEFIGHCKYLESEDKLIVAAGPKLGCRSTNGDQIFLKTILNAPNVPVDGKVSIELDIVKTGLLLTGLEKCLKSSHQTQKNQFQLVIMTLKTAYEKVVSKMKDITSQEIKWLSVCLTMDHDVLMKVFNLALLICKQEKRGPALPIVGDVLQRLTAMQRTSFDNVSSEKRLMFNEVDRLQTFNSWPHMNYKWALPGPMAEAGFYHPHSAKTAEDRAMCFTCSVCLVSWESTDQPWSEHKRHSKNCPFITGEYTENVPLQVYSSSVAAQELQRPNDKIVCMSSSCNNLIATGTEEGYIVIWNIFPTLKIHSEYQISVSAMKESKKKSKSGKAKKTTATATSTEKFQEADIVQNIEDMKTEREIIDSIVMDGVDGEMSVTNIEGQGEVTDVLFEGESYCVIPDPLKEQQLGIKSQLHKKTVPEKPHIFSMEDSMLKSEDEGSPSTIDPTPEEGLPKGRLERKCKITSVTIIYDEKEGNTFVVAGVKIKSKKIRKKKVKVKNKLSLLVYKVAGKVKVKGEPAENSNGTFGNVYMGGSFMPMQMNPGYDFAMGSDGDLTPPYEPVDPSQLSVIDEYLLAAQKNPSANGGTQNISLMNEVKSGFDQEEIVKVDDIKTVYEDCVFHKFDIDRAFYDISMVISELLVVDNYLIVLLKQGKKKIVDQPSNAKNVLMVFSILSNKKQITEIKLMNSHTIFGTFIQDALEVSRSNLPSSLLANLNALEQFENMDQGEEHVRSKSLLLIALGDNSMSFMTIPNLAEKKFLTLLDSDRTIHKIAYCGPLSSVAICDDKGFFHIQPCANGSKAAASKDSMEKYKGQYPERFSKEELEQLVEIIQFETVTQGCYLFYPINWYFSRGNPMKTMKTSPVLKNTFHMSPMETDKRLLKQTAETSNKTDFFFHMFVMVKTLVGYFDILVNLKSSLKPGEDFECSVYIDEANCQEKHPSYCTTSKVDKTKNIYGPVLFSTVMNEARSSGQFTVITPDLIKERSISMIVQLHPVKNSTSAETQTNLQLPVTIADLYIGVHQFKSVPSVASDYLFDGFQSVLASEESIHRSLVVQLLDLIENNGDMKEGGEIKSIVNILLWIVSIHHHSVDKDRLSLVCVIVEKLPEFIRALLFYGDRSCCRSCCLLLTAMGRQTSNKEFISKTLEELWGMMPIIHNARSSAAIHWMFVLLLDFLGLDNADEKAIQKFTKVLLEAGNSYGNGLTEIQKVLDAKYGWSEMVFQPVLVDPLNLKVKSGNTVKTLTSHTLETVQISTDHLPGILEVMPLQFGCLSVSEGSKVDQIKSKTGKSKTSKTDHSTDHVNNPFMQPNLLPPPNLSSMAAAKANVDIKEKAKQMDLLDFLSYMPGYSVGVGPQPGPSKFDGYDTGGSKSSRSDFDGMTDDSVIPSPHCLFVEKMHIYSVHYAILDFKTQVYLTDLVLPPCKALANVTITAWNWGETADDGVILASTEDINKNALVISNLVSPVKLRFLKVLVVGGDSCSVVIPLGQYYGYHSNEAPSNRENMQKHYSDLFCRFALAVERIKPQSNRVQLTTLKSNMNKTNVNLVLGNTKKDYALCSHLQLCLNFLSNHLWSGGSNPLEKRDLKGKLAPVTENTFSSQQLLLSCTLKSVLFYLASTPERATEDATSGQKHEPLTKDEFLSLFLQICIYGVSSIHETATSVLFKLCSNCSWWEDGLIDVYQQCFGYSPAVPLPKRRLFHTLMKLMKHSKGLNVIVEKLLHQLKHQLRLSTPPTTTTSTFPSSLDWLLFALNHLLDNKEISMWDFFNPWEFSPEQPSASSIPSSATMTPDSAPTIMPNIKTFNGMKQFIGETLNKQATMQFSQTVSLSPKSPTEDKPQQDFSPEEITEAPDSPSAEAANNNANLSEDTPREITGDVFLSKTTCIPVLQTLIDFILSKLEFGNQDQLILCCKVCSLVLMRCQGLIHMEEFMTSKSLKTLLQFCLKDQIKKKWISFALNILLKSVIIQKDLILKEIGFLKDPKKAKSLGKDTGLCVMFENREASKAGKTITDQMAKLEQLKMLKEKAMHKNFFEATEGKYGGGSADRLKEIAVSDREQDLSMAPVQCNVVHPQLNHFNKILESNVTVLESKLWQQRNTNLSGSSKPPQKLWIPNCRQFGNEVNSMKTASMLYLFTVVGETLKEQGYEVSIPCVEEILFLLDLLQKAGVELGAESSTALCNHILELVLKVGNSMNPCLKSAINKMVEILLEFPLVAPYFSYQLLQMQNRPVEQPSAPPVPWMSSNKFVELNLMSLRRLVGMSVLEDDNRVMLKELMVNTMFSEFTETSALLEIFKQIIQKGVFLQWGDGREVEITQQLACKLSEHIELFTRESVTLLYNAYDRNDSKRTVYLLHDGKCRLTGKAHMILEDLNICLSMVNVLHVIFTSKILQSNMDDPCIKKVFANIVRTLVLSHKLTGPLKMPEVTHDTINMPEEMFYFQISAKLHPFSSSLLYTLIEAAQTDFVPIVVDSVISVMGEILHGESKDLQFVGIKLLLKLMLTQNCEAWVQFENKGGFDVLLSAIINGTRHRLSWLDISRSSHVLQNLHASSIISLSKNALEKDKVRKDQDGDVLENFAPYAKIAGPPSSPGADVLLGNKSPLRRSRFPAWGHHFQETDDCWICLDISFPFEIMLKEIVIHMHGNYLIGTPSGVIVEIKNLSHYTTMCPMLNTGGLQSIVMHFAESHICKELRLRLSRPNGGDHIKLNLIELFGKPIFSVEAFQMLPFSTSNVKWLKLEPCITLLAQILVERFKILEVFTARKSFRECLLSILESMPFLSRGCLLQVSNLIVNKIILSRSPQLAIEITKALTSNIMDAKCLLLYHTSQMSLMIKFLADIVVGVPLDLQEEIFCHLLGWFHGFLHEVNMNDAYVANTIQTLVSKIFKLMKKIDVTLHQLDDKQGLIRKIQELLTQDSPKLHFSVFMSLGQLLNILVSLSSFGFAEVYCKAEEWVKNLRDNAEATDDQFNDCLATLYCCSKDNRDQCYRLLDDLVEYFCSVLANGKSNGKTLEANDIKKLANVLRVLKLTFAIDSNVLRAWFLTAPGQSFWKPLLGWLIDYGNHQLGSNSLFMFRTLQIGVTLFQKILYLNSTLQETFCQLLLETLAENNQRALYMSGYLKFILHQLVIVDDTVTFSFKMRNATYMLQSAHQIQLRLSYSVGDIVQTILKFRKTVYASGGSNPEEGSEKTTPATKAFDHTYAADPVIYSGNLAASKRKSKHKYEISKQHKSKLSRIASTDTSNLTVDFYLPEISDSVLPSNIKIGQILQILYETGQLSAMPTLVYSISPVAEKKSSGEELEETKVLLQHKPMMTLLERFALCGGLPLLMPHQDNLGSIGGSGNSNYINLFTKILPLPGYAKVFLQDRKKAELLLRLMLGVKETKLGQQISTLVVAQDLSTLPLTTLRDLLQQSCVLTTDGYDLRKLAFERNVVTFVMESLNTLYFHNEGKDTKLPQLPANTANASLQPATITAANASDVTYWAKGTGFGTGSTVSNWDIEKAMKRKKKEEEDMVIIFQVLTAFVRKHATTAKIPATPSSPADEGDQVTSQEDLDKLMSAFEESLSASCTIDILSAYLHNDSVLDMSRHIPLYHAVLALLRPLADNRNTLLPLIKRKTEGHTIVALLIKLRSCVDTYNSRLRVTTKLEAQKSAEDRKKPDIQLKSRLKVSSVASGNAGRKEREQMLAEQQSEAEMEDLTILLADINNTTDFVLLKVEEHRKEMEALKHSQTGDESLPGYVEFLQEDGSQGACSQEEASEEEIYVDQMMEMQFDAYELITEKEDGTLQFNVPYNYANLVREVRRKDADVFNINRARRLAQEVASLSTSLPISYSSTVFLRCDEQRLDIMKVLITGPEGTPYENGCYEFDVYIPPEYPSSPMSVNLQTTGKHTVRFNPNLYNDGKVCLSILNTWHGRPEEKWNEKTSNLLQVLVSIQSLILVADPYFNEPGYERLRGTPQGQQNSSDYNANIQQASVKWAILEQIKRPSACFKEVIHKHFLSKKDKVLTQCQTWINNLKELASKRKSTKHHYDALKLHFTELKLELLKLEKANLEKTCSKSNITDPNNDAGDDIQKQLEKETQPGTALTDTKEDAPSFSQV